LPDLPRFWTLTPALPLQGGGRRGQARSGFHGACKRILIQKRKRHRLFVAGLLVENRQIDRSAGETRGRAGFESAELKAEARQAAGKAARGGFADSPAGGLRFAGVHQGAEERAGGDDHGPAIQAAAVFERHRRDAAGIGDDVLDFAGDDLQAASAGEEALDLGGVAVFVGLRPGAPDGGALAAIQHAELDAGGVGGQAHQAAEGVDLADHLPLGQPADGGVARHGADARRIECHQRHRRAESGRGPRGFGAGVATADDDDVVIARHVMQFRW
jgi:hypothetical protein